MQKKKIAETVFAELKGDNLPTVLESLCPNCQENGETRLLLTKIPFFKEIIVSSFYCDNCGYRNNQVQFGGQLPDYGVQILFKVLNKTDLNREIIISDHAKIWIQELNLQMPKLKKPQITTIQGLLLGIEDDLVALQQQRKQIQPERYEQINKFLEKLRQYSSGSKFPLSIRIKDPSGNSNIKNPYAPKMDKNLQFTSIPRTLEDLNKMGYSIQNAKQQLKLIQQKKLGKKINFTKPFQQNQFMKYQPVSFDVPCHSCQMPGQMKMCQISVPYFTDMVIMSFSCDYCGAHSTQTKNTGSVADEGCIITLKCQNDVDLKRDLFKSETCKVVIPEVELQLDYGTLGGVFTTVEGLIQKIVDHLGEQNPFADSDSAFHDRMEKLLKQLQELQNGGTPFTLIIKDPFGHSFLQNPDHPNEDKRATRIKYERTTQENDILGLLDMKTEGYQKSDTKSTGSMKKSKDRKYSEGSVQSIDQLTKQQPSHGKIQQIPQIKFTKQSPCKQQSQQKIQAPNKQQ